MGNFLCSKDYENRIWDTSRFRANTQGYDIEFDLDDGKGAPLCFYQPRRAG